MYLFLQMNEWQRVCCWAIGPNPEEAAKRLRTAWERHQREKPCYPNEHVGERVEHTVDGELAGLIFGTKVRPR